MIRRAVAVVLVSLVAILAVAPSALACAGWQPTATARAACCASRNHQCAKTGNSDSCCAQKESRRHSEQAPSWHVDGTVAIVPAIAAAPLAAQLVVLPSTLVLSARSLDTPDQSSLYLRHSLLRV